MLTTQKNTVDTTMTLGIVGRLDTQTAPQLEKVISDELEGITKLIFDLKDMEYISSAGLRVLLTAQKKMKKQGEMELCNVGELAMEVFEVTGFAGILNIR